MHALYSAFDVFPSPKGAATHIAHTVLCMEKLFKSVTLTCLGHLDMPGYQMEGSITIRRFPVTESNFLKRTEHFAYFLNQLINNINRPLDVVHFRDIWSAACLITHKKLRQTKFVFEVNSLPSVELPLRYPKITTNSLFYNHLKKREQHVLHYAHKIIVVSHITAQFIQKEHNVPRHKIHVVPNTTDMETQKKTLSNTFNIVYVGTLSPWQGLPVLLNAYKLLCNQVQGRLVILASNLKYIKQIQILIDDLGIGEKVTIEVSATRVRVKEVLESALCSVAPLTRCDRNELQGCCPIKILESMAQGVPVIASDLPVCREIITHQVDGWLTTPDSARSLAGAILHLHTNPLLAKQLGQKAREKILSHFSKTSFHGKLQSVYTELLQDTK